MLRVITSSFSELDLTGTAREQQLKRVLKKLEKLATIESELSEISAKHVEER